MTRNQIKMELIPDKETPKKIRFAVTEATLNDNVSVAVYLTKNFAKVVAAGRPTITLEFDVPSA
jgi:hypothetical protein